MDLGAAQMLVAMATGIASAFAAAVVLGWKVRGWIADINDKRVIAMAGLEGRLGTLMTSRHEENLARFGEINERLARMGNGSRPA